MTETAAVKVDESRREFESWFADNMFIGEKCIADAQTKRRMFRAWVASRAALAVDIASHTEFEIEHMISPEKEGYSIGWIDGRNYSVEQVRAAGITVKGDS